MHTNTHTLSNAHKKYHGRSGANFAAGDDPRRPHTTITTAPATADTINPPHPSLHFRHHPRSPSPSGVASPLARARAASSCCLPGAGGALSSDPLKRPLHNLCVALACSLLFTRKLFRAMRTALSPGASFPACVHVGHVLQ